MCQFDVKHQELPEIKQEISQAAYTTTLQENVCWSYGNKQFFKAKVYGKTWLLAIQLQNCFPKAIACYWAFTTVGGKRYTEFSCERWMSPAGRGFYMLVLRSDIFHLSCCSVLHGYYNISLLKKEGIKYWRQNYNIEGEIWVEFPMVVWGFYSQTGQPSRI